MNKLKKDCKLRCVKVGGLFQNSEHGEMDLFRGVYFII